MLLHLWSEWDTARVFAELRFENIGVRCLYQGHNDALPSLGIELRFDSPPSNCQLVFLFTELHRRHIWDITIKYISQRHSRMLCSQCGRRIDNLLTAIVRSKRLSYAAALCL